MKSHCWSAPIKGDLTAALKMSLACQGRTSMRPKQTSLPCQEAGGSVRSKCLIHFRDKKSVGGTRTDVLNLYPQISSKNK